LRPRLAQDGAKPRFSALSRFGNFFARAALEFPPARVLRCRKPFYFPVGALFFDFSACLLSANRFPLPDCAGRADILRADIVEIGAAGVNEKSRARAGRKHYCSRKSALCFP